MRSRLTSSQSLTATSRPTSARSSSSPAITRGERVLAAKELTDGSVHALGKLLHHPMGAFGNAHGLQVGDELVEPFEQLGTQRDVAHAPDDQRLRRGRPS